MIDADRIIVMESGQIQAEGTHRELLDPDALYHSLIETLRIADRAPTDPALVPVESPQ